MNFSQIITKINTTLSSVNKIEKIYAYATTKIEGFPAVVYLPTRFDNSISGNRENLVEYEFTIWVIVEAMNSLATNVVISDYLAPTVDAIIEAFKSDWNFSTSDTIVVLTGGDWTTTENENGLTFNAELKLKIKTINNL